MRLAILNFSDGRYARGQERLKTSLLEYNILDDQIHFWDAYPDHWTKNSEVTMAFKTCAFQDILDKGYTAGLWVDANCVCVQSIEPILEKMENEGMYLFSRYGDSVGNWISDLALKELGVSREETHRMPELGACVIGINFNHPSGKDFFRRWQHAARAKKPFNGIESPTPFADTRNNDTLLLSKDARVKGHRADQSVAGIIAGQLSIKPDHRFVFDLIGESKQGAKYATYVPYTTIFIQNRDIKKEGEIITDHSHFINNSNFFYRLGRLVYSLKRLTKDYIRMKIKSKQFPILKS